jgi:hypothetical protein
MSIRGPEFCIYQYRSKFKGEAFRTELPALIHLPTAA